MNWRKWMNLRYIWGVIGFVGFGVMGYFLGDQGILTGIPRVWGALISALMGGFAGLMFSGDDE